MSKRAIVLAGGAGTRLRPYTVVLPKPLMPIGDYPIVEVVVRQLARHGYDHITMAVNYQAEIIKAFFEDGSKWGVKIDYSLEKVPLGTIGPLKIIGNLPENFLIINGDVLTNMHFGEFYDQHVANGSIFTTASSEREHKIDYGILKVGDDNSLQGFEEKPVTKYSVGMGAYMANRKILDFIPDNIVYGVDNLMKDLLSRGASVSVKQFPGYWMDIGRPDDYMQAIEDFEKMKNTFLG